MYPNRHNHFLCSKPQKEEAPLLRSKKVARRQSEDAKLGRSIKAQARQETIRYLAKTTSERHWSENKPGVKPQGKGKKK